MQLRKGPFSQPADDKCQQVVSGSAAPFTCKCSLSYHTATLKVGVEIMEQKIFWLDPCYIRRTVDRSGGTIKQGGNTKSILECWALEKVNIESSDTVFLAAVCMCGELCFEKYKEIVSRNELVSLLHIQK